MLHKRITIILHHESPLEYIPLGRIKRLVSDGIDELSLLRSSYSLIACTVSKRSSDLRLLYRSLSRVILRLKSSGFFRFLRVRICHVLALCSIPVTILIVRDVHLVLSVGIPSVLIERI